MKIKHITPVALGTLQAKYKNDDGTFFYQPIAAMATVEEQLDGDKYDVIHPVVVWEEDGFEVESGDTDNFVGIEYGAVDKVLNTEKKEMYFPIDTNVTDWKKSVAITFN